MSEEIQKAQTKKSVRRHLFEWALTLGAAGLVLYFFAPFTLRSGVTKIAERRPSQAVSLKKLDGGAWRLEDLRGRVVVVNYWATWCGPCRLETPSLVSIANEYKARDFEMVGVTVDDDLELVPPFIERFKIPYLIAVPGLDPHLDENIALPTTFLYDKNGRLARKYVGIVLESTLKADIETLLDETL